MHKSPRPRRRRRYGAQLCALIAALLLLLSVSVLYSHLGFDRDHPPLHYHNDAAFDSDSLLDDGDPLGDRISSAGSDDRIDVHDVVQEDSEPNEEDILRTGEEDSDQPGVSGYYFDHIKGVVRRAFDKRSIDEWEDYVSFDPNLMVNSEDQSKAAFASDDIPMDENVRTKMDRLKSIEDLLLLVKKSPLREGWGEWFDKKSDFLRRDRMFKSHLELLNPMNNPLLQDPDGTGVTGLTRGDKIVLKGLLNEFKKVHFLVKKPLAAVDSLRESKLESGFKSDLIEDGIESVEDKFGGNEIREMNRGKRRTLDSNNGSNGSYRRNIVDKIHSLNVPVLSNSSAKSDKNEGFEERNRGNKVKVVDSSNGNLAQLARSKNVETNGGTKPVYADGKRWGYFPGIDPRLSFSNFMDAFFRKGKCFMRVFMVWNSPPWMFSIRHQRGLESLLLQHRDVCVVVFSETIELNFFDSLVKDGFKVAVVMPNLDELLKDTPTHIFASVWLEWKKTKFYSIHYSELVRLAVLYKYGGIYLDSDIVVLKPLSSLTNTVGLENGHAGSSLNGAVMAFNKHSSFILECLKEFYSSYDDTRLSWNGADLLTRVAKHFLNTESSSNEQMKLKLQPSFAFFPIGKREITRYFTAPSTNIEQAEQEVLLQKILNDSLTFHFWNSWTSALIPEPESLVAQLMNHQCIHCSDVL